MLRNNLRWVEKEKVSDWLGLPYEEERQANPKLDSVAKIINEFENPTIPEEKNEENSVKAQYSLQGNSMTEEEQSIVDEAKANGTYLKAPNGKQSNLNERQWIQVRTKAFKDWFGDWEKDHENASKVVDENGEPMVAYHSGNEGINVFSREFDKQGIGRQFWGKGFYFGTAKSKDEWARRYKNKTGNDATQYAVYLNIKNPIYTAVDGEVKDSGYDGVIIPPKKTVEGETDYMYIVAEPTQIKSATENVGKFDASNPDIRYSLFGGNSGYTERMDGTKISKRASYAEDEGSYTAGTFRKVYGIPKRDFDALVAIGVIENTEWHHTGANFKKSDFYSWEDSYHHNVHGVEYGDGIPEGSLAEKYNDNKKEISKLAKEFEGASWEHRSPKEKRYVPQFNNFVFEHYPTIDALTDEEREELKTRHKAISASDYSSSTRYELHRDLDMEYQKKALDRYIAEHTEELQKDYNAQYGDVIAMNEEADTYNEVVEDYNNATNGKEKILEEIAQLMGVDAKSKIAEVSRKERLAKERQEKSKIKDAMLSEMTTNLNKWIDTQKKKGNITYKERIPLSSKPVYFFEEKREMNGKYGWFESSSRYNLPEYVSGLEFASKRVYDSYRKRVNDINEVRYKDPMRFSLASDMARDAVMTALEGAGIDVEMATPEMVEDVLRARDAEFMSAKKRRALETVSSQDEYQQTVVSSADGAKVLKNLDSLAKEYQENTVTHEKTFLGKVAEAIGAKKYGSNSQYATFETVNGKIVTIRLADHNATVSNFDIKNESEGISIVVSAKKSEGIYNDGDAHIVEYYYDAIKLRKAEGKPLADIVKSIKQALYSGVFNDNTGLAEYQEVNIPEFHIAYHGSGAKFDEFDHSHIGEGEGAQAYGWGTYLTEVEGIAKCYAKAYDTSQTLGERDWEQLNVNIADTLSEEIGIELPIEVGWTGDGFEVFERILRSNYDPNNVMKKEHYEALADYFNYDLDSYEGDYDEFWNEVEYDLIDVATKIAKRLEEEMETPKPMLYTVEIPDDNGSNYLDYDKEMSKKELNEVRNKLEAILAEGDYKGVEKELKRELDSVFVDGLTASDVYGNVSAYLGGDKQASEFFNEMGYVGIKYPANYRSGGNEDGKKNFVIFNDSDMTITDRVEFLQTPDGTVYGWTIGGKIFLTEQGVNAETPIHEYTHLWANAMRRNNEQGWESVKDLLRGTPMWDEVLADKTIQTFMTMKIW